MAIVVITKLIFCNCSINVEYILADFQHMDIFDVNGIRCFYKNARLSAQPFWIEIRIFTFHIAYWYAKLFSWFASLPLLKVAMIDGLDLWWLCIHILWHWFVCFNFSIYSSDTFLEYWIFSPRTYDRTYFVDELSVTTAYSFCSISDQKFIY